MVRPIYRAILLASACSGGPSDASRLNRLQVMAAVTEPPQVAPGAETVLSVWIADPVGRGVEAMVWACTDFGYGCLEGSFPVNERVTTLVVVDGVATASVTLSDALEPLLAGGDLPISLWVLACEPGLCPLIGQAAAGTATEEQLADPAGVLAQLPLDGVSLVRRDVLVSIAPDPNANPVFVQVPEAATLRAETGREVSLAFTVEDREELVAVAYTTRGALSVPAIEGAALDMTWFTEKTPGEAELWLVVEDGLGGSAVWREAGSVAGR